MNNLCESCVKRKTMYCPNSSKCYSKQDKPYWESGLMLLQKLEAYENMRKEVIKIIESYNLGKYDYSIPPIGIIDLLDILNKVGGSDE